MSAMKNKLSIYFDFISTSSLLWCVSPFADVGLTLYLCRLHIWKNEQERRLKITSPQFYSFGHYRKLNLAVTLSCLATTPVTRFIFNDFHDVTRSPFQGERTYSECQHLFAAVQLLFHSFSFLSAFSQGETVCFPSAELFYPPSSE